MAFIARATQTRFGARGAGFGFLGEYPLGLVEIDDRHRITAPPLGCAINPRRQVGFVLGPVCSLRYLRLSWKITREAIFPAGKLNPFLREQRPRDGENQGCRNEWRQ